MDNVHAEVNRLSCGCRIFVILYQKLQLGGFLQKEGFLDELFFCFGDSTKRLLKSLSFLIWAVECDLWPSQVELFPICEGNVLVPPILLKHSSISLPALDLSPDPQNQLCWWQYLCHCLLPHPSYPCLPHYSFNSSAAIVHFGAYSCTSYK
eukprot:12724262-Ditylum_brightwellii.AAC.1